MRRAARGAGLLIGLLAVGLHARAEYNYHGPTELLLSLGTQALMTCNGLFVSNRTLDQIYEQELKLDRMPILPAEKVQIDTTLRTVAVGDGSFPAPVMRAVYREGLGCIVLAPDQTFADVASLPELRVPPAPGDASTLPWPDGDLVPSRPLPRDVDARALEAAWDWAFDRKTHGHPSEVTLSLLVVHKGEIVFERYAPGVDVTTRTRTWSTAKSIAATLVGIAVSQGKLELDAPIPYPEGDPRRSVTLRHVLHMSSGLDPVDNGARCAAVGSCLSYFGGAGSVAGALARGLVSQPGTRWDYENYDTILAVHALKTALGARDYLAFPRAALLDRIGMRSTLPGVDRFGDYVLSSQVYTNARDLARFGLLYLNRGRWPGPQGATVIPESWVDFSRTPAPASVAGGRFYGAQWWLPPDDRTDVPADAYATAGNRGQYTIVVPSHDTVIVRRGLDWLPREHSFPRWDLTREVLKAFPKRPGGAKPQARP